MSKRNFSITWSITIALLATLFKFMYPETDVMSVSTVIAIVAALISFAILKIFERFNKKNSDEN